jgi:hypothetical protein
MKKKISTIAFSILLIISCSSSDASAVQKNQTPTSGEPIKSNDWLYPISEIRDGGPGKDGIPSIDSPKFVPVDQAPSILSDHLLVVGIKVDDVTRAYPHFILDWHEIVNDNVKGVNVAVSLCPLTGTSIGWSRKVNGALTTFGVSGKLYNSNLIPYDRSTNSNWSQVGLQCINGSLIGERPDFVTVLETTWGVWKTMFPETKVLTTDTGFSRNYGVYPYGDYRTNNSYLIFPLTNEDDRIPAKERVHAIIEDDEAKVYKFDAFESGKIRRDKFKGKDILLVGDDNIIVSFELDATDSILEFEYDYRDSEGFFRDNEGTLWNVFGEAISGPGQGKKLAPTISFIAYWFSIGAFYPDAGIYE